MTKKPDGAVLLARLIDLWADQQGVNITYKIIDKEAQQWKDTKQGA